MQRKRTNYTFTVRRRMRGGEKDPTCTPSHMGEDTRLHQPLAQLLGVLSGPKAGNLLVIFHRPPAGPPDRLLMSERPRCWGASQGRGSVSNYTSCSLALFLIDDFSFKPSFMSSSCCFAPCSPFSDVLSLLFLFLGL